MASVFPRAEKYLSGLARQMNRVRQQGGRGLPGPYAALLCLLALAGWVGAGALWFSHPASHPIQPPVVSKTATQLPAATAIKDPLPTAVETPAVPVAPDSHVQSGAKMRPYLGIRGESFRQGSQQGLTILEVFPGSPAALAGLRSKNDPMRTYGDVIIKANGHRIVSEGELRALLQESKPGDVVNLLVGSASGESFRKILVKLGAIPAGAAVRGRLAQAAEKSPRHGYVMSGLEREIFDQVNRVRAEYGRRPLMANPRLDEAARRHSARMAALDFFSHTDPDGRDVVDRLRAAGIDRFSSVGENIFYGQNLPDIVRAVVQGWLLSPPHRENLLSSSYGQAGVGVATGSGGRIYVTEDYLQK